MKTTSQIQQRLDYLRGELRAERISLGEIAELQDLAPFISREDVELLEAAGVPEFPEPPARAAAATNEKSMNASFNPYYKQKFTTHHRKEHGTCAHYIVLDLDDLHLGNASCQHRVFHEPVVLRLYWSKVTAYACLWVRGETALDAQGSTVRLMPGSSAGDGCGSASGSGRAAGYGYHKASAAAGEAIRNAGFTLSEAINGRGESAIVDALLAIAQCIGVRKPALIQAHN